MQALYFLFKNIKSYVNVYVCKSSIKNRVNILEGVSLNF